MDQQLAEPSFLRDWHAAEIAAVLHMRTLGFIDAQPTGPGADGGIDALSRDAAAQVKFYANPIGRPDVQRLWGAAHEYRLALFYSTGGYTKEAIAYASEAGVALFTMDPYGRCESVSDLAALLSEAGQVEERRNRMEELQANRYRLAAFALQNDYSLFVEFARRYVLIPEESVLYSHVMTGLDQSIKDFLNAVESRQFALADISFGEIQKRSAILKWLSGSDLTRDYSDIEGAISSGWQRDSTPGSDYLLQRVSSGVIDLKEALSDSLTGWNDNFPEGVRPEELVGIELTRFAGMLSVVSRDESVLTPELLDGLGYSIRVGVERLMLAANQVFEHLLVLHSSLRLEQPRALVAGMLRAESIAESIYCQLDVSGIT